MRWINTLRSIVRGGQGRFQPETLKVYHTCHSVHDHACFHFDNERSSSLKKLPVFLLARVHATPHAWKDSAGAVDRHCPNHVECRFVSTTTLCSDFWAEDGITMIDICGDTIRHGPINDDEILLGSTVLSAARPNEVRHSTLVRTLNT